MSNSIPLSDASINELTELCETVLRKNPKNEISVNMAKGISDYIATHRFATEKQALWLARNLDFYKLKRPVELLGLIVERKPPAIMTTVPATASTQVGFKSQIISSLSRIEKLLGDARH